MCHRRILSPPLCSFTLLALPILEVNKNAYQQPYFNEKKKKKDKNSFKQRTFDFLFSGLK